MTSLIDLINPRGTPGGQPGITLGIVTNTKDPDQLGRIKVQFPQLADSVESTWARVVSPMAGENRGFFAPPEVGDEVLVAFAQGQGEYPYVLGALWNGRDKPPIDNADGKNNQRLWRSRSGHEILFDDTDQAEKIVVRDGSGNTTITLDTQRNTISLQADQGITLETRGDLTLTSDGGALTLNGQTITLEAQDSFELKAGLRGTVETQDSFELKAGLRGTVEAQGKLALTCLAGVDINNGALEVT
jgi:phage baseplate assembly protein V